MSPQLGNPNACSSSVPVQHKVSMNLPFPVKGRQLPGVSELVSNHTTEQDAACGHLLHPWPRVCYSMQHQGESCEFILACGMSSVAVQV